MLAIEKAAAAGLTQRMVQQKLSPQPCRAASAPLMRPATPNQRPNAITAARKTAPTTFQAATYSRVLTIGFRATTPRPPSTVITRCTWPRAAGAGGLHLHQPAATLQAAPTVSGQTAERSRCPQPDGPQTQIQSWPGDLRAAHDGRRACVWPDQGNQTAESDPIAGPTLKFSANSQIPENPCSRKDLPPSH